MATLLLQVAGTAIGSVLGGPIGAAIGSAIGATAGNFIDRSLLAGGAKHTEGPRLKTLNGITATEGSPIPRLYGRARLGGQVIWATQFEEVATRNKVKTGGKGGSSTPTQTTYSYFANVAVALCEGEIAFVRAYLGRRQAARPDDDHHARLYGQRKPDTRSADHREGRAERWARLSRRGLYRPRTSAAG